MKKITFLVAFIALAASFAYAQPERWQQRVNYEMQIDMDAAKHQYHGLQHLVYTNNSPDTLDKVFYHLYFNAFQPGSMMDVRSRTIEDPDSRVADRIFKLKPEEEGWIRLNGLKQNGQPVRYVMDETILKVMLNEPLMPNSSVTLDMDWNAQVPIQIRRSGRDNKEGVAYSMAQWYPKLCEYDYQGWHSNPYIAREFYGVWGDFDVTINIDKNYVVAAGGYLQNPLEIGYGYEEPGQTIKRPSGDRLAYHFKSPNVHDFVWAADPDFTQLKINADDGSIMHFFWKKGKGYDENWQKLATIMNKARNSMNAHFGKYPYKEYYFIQGGDGGMEYPMATLIQGSGAVPNLTGTAIHEQLHSWYQMILGSNESLYPWMDEGFTSYAEAIVGNELAATGILSWRKFSENPHTNTYRGYQSLAQSGKEEPMSTHADHYSTNYAYSLASYVKGAVFLNQLEYIIGPQNLSAGLLRYFNTWKFKHPNPNDFIRVMEKQSGLELDWYKEDWVNTVNTIDYGVQKVDTLQDGKTKITIERRGKMAMPLDILVTYRDGQKDLFYAPLESMRGEKPAENYYNRIILPNHRWVDPVYTFTTAKSNPVVKIEIDPTGRMADINKANNVWNADH
jgi:hypothetical protein